MCILCTDYVLAQWYNKERTILNQVQVILFSRIQVQSIFYGLVQLRDSPVQGNKDGKMGQRGPNEEIWKCKEYCVLSSATGIRWKETFIVGPTGSPNQILTHASIFPSGRLAVWENLQSYNPGTHQSSKEHFSLNISQRKGMSSLKKSLRPGLGCSAAATERVNRASSSAQAISLPNADRHIESWLWQHEWLS